MMVTSGLTKILCYTIQRKLSFSCWMWARKLLILRPSVVSRPWGKAAWGQILEVLEEHGEEQHRKKTWGSIVFWSGSNLQTVLLVFLFKPVFVSMVHGFAKSASLGKWIPMQILGRIPDQINQKLGVFLADLCGRVRSPWHFPGTPKFEMLIWATLSQDFY